MPSVTVSQLDRLLESPGTALFDVRDAELYRLGHIPGAAHAPLAEIRERLSPLDREQPVYFVCQIGEQRSVEAARLAGEQLGFRQAFFVEGGTKAWQRADLPLEGEWARRLDGFSGQRAAAVPAPGKKPEGRTQG
ncbi:MAG: rhodanese-like domain-containing protein [Verrucomicrobium sp.]|nr:rhodanese-like domain-containing protein [Verrucomicrobium sp.]